MHLEVELKFRVADREELLARLGRLGLAWRGTIEQCDLYWAHPARDFAQTDEALRVRTVGEQCWITYKGPKLDALTKTRRELELPLGAGAATLGAWRELLSALGFRPVAEVRKSRRLGLIHWHGREVEVALDTLPTLGSYVEFELSAEQADVDGARQALLALAAALELHESLRTSYLELLLAQNPLAGERPA
ncbi:MAG: class IV adenylate cyclase [Pirellulales bacterium]